MNKTTRNVLIAFGTVAALVGGWQIGKFIRQKIDERKSSDGDENKSGFGGKGVKTLVYTITNPTNQKQDVFLFASRSMRKNPNVAITPSVGFFNRQIQSQPVEVKAIEFRSLGGTPPAAAQNPNQPANVGVVSTGSAQVQQPFVIKCKDASGHSETKVIYPLESPMQFQKGITGVTPEGLILDGECFMKYPMLPKSKVSIVLYYKPIKRR